MFELKRIALAAAVVAAPVLSHAAVLDLASLGYQRGAEVTSTAALLLYQAEQDLGGGVSLPASLNANSYDTLLSFFAANGVSDPGASGFGLGGELASPPTGGSAFGENTDLLQYLYQGVTGSGRYAALNGKSVLLEISATGLLFGATDGFWDATVTLTALDRLAPVPLPAGLPLLVLAVGGLGLLRRKSQG